MSHRRQLGRRLLPTLLLALLCAGGTATAQRFGNLWHFGNFVGLDFRNGAPAPLGGSSMISYEGCVSMSGRDGDSLLFYTNGEIVWNREHRLMQGSEGILGSITATQSAIAVPDPADSARYYLFTADAGLNVFPRTPVGIHYSRIDMRGDNGLGGMFEKNRPLLNPATERLTATRHANGRDYWVVAHETNTNCFYSWLVTAAGIGDTIVTCDGPVHRANASVSGTGDVGQMKISPDGRYLLVATQPSRAELYRFDNATGRLSEPLILFQDLINDAYGLSFSPSGCLFYVSSDDALYQYSLRDPRHGAILASRTAVAETSDTITARGLWSGSFQLGPDGRIYIARGARISVITHPDVEGIACGFQDVALPMPANQSLPNFVDAWFHRPGGCGIPRITAVAERLSTCVGTPIRFSLPWSRRRNIRFTWDFTGGTPERVRDADSVDVLYTTPGTYPVRLSWNDSTAGTGEVTGSITVYPPPAVDAGDDFRICRNGVDYLKARSLTNRPVTRVRWTPSAGLGCDSCFTTTFSPPVTTDYVITIETIDGCSASDTVRVVVDSALFVRAGRDTSICSGESAAIGSEETGVGVENVIYRWTPIDGLDDPTAPNPTAAPLLSTRYHLTATDTVGGCTTVDSVLVTVVQPPTTDAGEDAVICAGESVGIGVEGQGSGVGDENTIYRWTPIDGLDDPTSPTPTATPLLSTLYRLTATDTLSGCTAIDSVLVTVRPSPTADAGSDGVICAGESMMIGGREPGNGDEDRIYRWTPADGLDDPTSPTPTAAPLLSTLYHLTATDTTSGCRSIDSVLVTVRPSPAADAGSDAEICAGESVTIGVGDSGSGDEDVIYRWTPVAGLDDPTSPTPASAPLLSTLYYLTASDTTSGCTTVDSVLVRVRPTPMANAGDDRTICAGESVGIGVEDQGSGVGDENMVYQWTPIDGLDDPTSPTPTARPSISTIYHLTATDTISGCSSIDSTTVSVRPAPAADAGDDRTICEGESVGIGGPQSGSPHVIYQWTPVEGLDNPTSPAPTATPLISMIYHLTATDTTSGCTAIDSMLVAVAPPERVRIGIDRDYRSRNGEPMTIAIASDPFPSGNAIDSLSIDLAYDGSIMLLDAGSIDLTGTPLDGWSVEIIEEMPGTLHLLVTAPDGRALIGGDTLLRIVGRMFLGERLATEIGLAVGENGRCVDLIASPGRATHDTVCGLNLRLIEFGLGKYAAPRAVPNPARGVVKVEFGLGLDGPTRLEIHDAAGRRVGMLVDAVLQPGGYAVEWDVSELGAGIYYLTLRSGAWEGLGRALVE